MRTRRTLRESVWLGGAAFAALVAAHALTYFIEAPDHHDRTELLHETGHASWTSVFILAGAALIAALIAFAHRWASPADRSLGTRRLLGHAWSRLVPLQVSGFVLLEFVERMSAHGRPLATFFEDVVLLGIAVQVVAALACGLLLVGFTRLVRKLRSARPIPRERRTLAAHPPRSLRPTAVSVARLAWNLRGPPVALRSG